MYFAGGRAAVSVTAVLIVLVLIPPYLFGGGI